MNKDIIEGKWQEVKGKVRQQWAEFTKDDVEHMKGSYEELSGKIQKKYGYEKDKAEKQLNEFIERNRFDK